MAEKHPEVGLSAEALGGLRLTKQRRVVYEVLVDDKRDHPTAAEVFERAKHLMPSISLATVYNCLETLTQAGAVRQVNLDREATRYCPNLKPHAHFYCTRCHQVADVCLEEGRQIDSLWELAEGTLVSEIEVTVKGVCPACQPEKE